MLKNFHPFSIFFLLPSNFSTPNSSSSTILKINFTTHRKNLNVISRICTTEIKFSLALLMMSYDLWLCQCREASPTTKLLLCVFYTFYMRTKHFLQTSSANIRIRHVIKVFNEKKRKSWEMSFEMQNKY